MTIRHYLIGYSKTDGNQQVEIAIPSGQMAAVKKLLSLYPDDPDMLDPHELQPGQAKEIAELAGSRLSDDPQDYFLQAFEQTPPRAKESANA